MEIYLIRHPETSAPKGTCYGRTDYPLLDPVSKTLPYTLSFLPNSYDEMVVSPAPRALSLARAIEEALRPGIASALVEDPRIREMDFGDWDGKLWESIPRTETTPWMKSFVTARTPNGEAFTDVIARVSAFLQDWIPGGSKYETWCKKNQRSIERLFVVCHSGPIRALLCQYKGIPYEDAFRDTIAFGSAHRMDV